MFKKILIANRGEIALRILRSCRQMGIESVAVHSTADANAMHVRLADESVCIGQPRAADSYLNVPAIISAATITGADAIHPGIGFLSENANFAEIVEEHGLAFIGPIPEHINIMGDKIEAKKTAIELGIPTVPGSSGSVESAEEAIKVAEEIGFPVIIKAASGGGGRGMQVVRNKEALAEALNLTQSEAAANFGNAQVYMEKYLGHPRHIEVQIIADGQGNVLHLGERDCSIQRRHQKVIEISPSPRLAPQVRKELYRICQKAIYRLGYESVGTVEFLVDENDRIYFIEMNTRIQVEHPVTEIISGVDLIQRMIQIAEGDKLHFLQEEIAFRGYAIEFRINAEDVKNDFMPSFGTITEYLTPGGPGVRLDGSVYAGYSIPPHYDSMIAKLIVWALDWEGVVRKARRALDEFIIEGIETNIPLHKEIVYDDDFIEGKFTTSFLDERMEQFALLKSLNPDKEERTGSFMSRLIQKGLVTLKGDFV